MNGTLEKECTRNGTAPPGKGHTKPGDGSLWNGMVLPFLNMTIKGVLWYQVSFHRCANSLPTAVLTRYHILTYVLTYVTLF